MGGGSLLVVAQCRGGPKLHSLKKNLPEIEWSALRGSSLSAYEIRPHAKFEVQFEVKICSNQAAQILVGNQVPIVTNRQ